MSEFCSRVDEHLLRTLTEIHVTRETTMVLRLLLIWRVWGILSPTKIIPYTRTRIA